MRIMEPLRFGAIAVVPSAASLVDTRDLAAQADYLVIRRSRNVAAPNTLCFPGGGIEPKESAMEAVVRECFEETKAQVRVARKIWENVTPWNVHLDWFLATLIDPNAPLIPKRDEVAEIFWTDFAALRNDPDLLKSNVEFLEKVLSGAIDLSLPTGGGRNENF